MSELSQIVSVSISANSRTPSRTGFGTLLFLDFHSVFTDHYRTYTDLAGMASDGFSVYSPQYRAAAAAFGQNPAPASIVIGRLPAAPSTTWTVVCTSAVQGDHVKLTVVSPDGTVTPIDYTILAAATTTTVATAIELLIEACPGIDSTSSTATVTVTPTTSGQRFWIYGEQNCEIKETTAAAGYDTELTALQLLTDDWYFVCIGSNSQANVNAVAAWAQAQTKLFFAATGATDELTGVGTFGSTLKTAAYTRTVALYASNTAQLPADAWVGVGAPQDPGSITWAFKTLAGVTASILTSTQRSNLETDNINHYQTVAGVNITRQAKVASGEYIDIIHGIDALQARIQEDVFALLANSKKIANTASGKDLIANAILGAMKAFEGTTEQPGLLDVGTSVVNMDNAVVSGRNLTGVRFSATLAGAIHFVSIVGTLSV